MTITHRRWIGRAAEQVGSIFITLFGLLILTFVIGRIMPNDPVRAIVGEDATPEVYQNVYHQLGFDRPHVAAVPDVSARRAAF